MSAGDKAWPEKDLKILRDNWGKMPTIDIGRLFKPVRSKAAVIGKAHKLNLHRLTKPARAAVQVPQQTPEEIAEAAEWRRLMHWESGDPALWKNRPTA